jgi:uncharacterized protein YndB with AHSA1/START domain
MKYLTRSRKGGRSEPTAEPPAAIHVACRYSVSPERVFNAWLDPEIAGRWLFATASHPMTHVEIDARVEGSFCFAEQRGGESIRHTGEYIEIVPHRRLVFTLCMEEHPHATTRVKVEIVPLKTGCELVLTHKGVPPAYASHTKARWTGILYGLGVTLDSRSRRAGSS